MKLHATVTDETSCRPDPTRVYRIAGHSTARELAVDAARLATIDRLATTRAGSRLPKLRTMSALVRPLNAVQRKAERTAIIEISRVAVMERACLRDEDSV